MENLHHQYNIANGKNGLEENLSLIIPSFDGHPEGRTKT